MKKLEIKERLHLYLDRHTFQGSLEQVIKNLEDIPNRLMQENPIVMKDPKRFIRFELNNDYDYHDETLEVSLYGVRLETDEELEKRADRAKRAKESANKAAVTRSKSKDKRERDLYEKLKEKYDK